MAYIARNVLVPVAVFAAAYFASLVLFGLYLMAPFTLLLALVALLWLRVSFISAIALVLGITLAFAAQFGPLGAAVALLMYVPGAAAAVITLRKGYRLFDAAAAAAAASIAGAACALGLVTLLAGDIAVLIRRLFETLYVDIDEQAQRAFYPVLNPLLGGASGDTLAQMRDRVVGLVYGIEDSLRLLLPARVLEHAAVSGFLAVAVPRCILLRSGRDEGMARFTPIHKWRVPRGVQVGLAALFFATLPGYLFGIEVLDAAFQAAWSLLCAVYAVMGCALADRLMLKSGVKPGVRMSLLLLVYTFLRTPLFIMGMVEMLMQTWNRRKAEREGGV